MLIRIFPSKMKIFFEEFDSHLKRKHLYDIIYGYEKGLVIGDKISIIFVVGDHSKSCFSQIIVPISLEVL